jgi:hypothetical protein
MKHFFAPIFAFLKMRSNKKCTANAAETENRARMLRVQLERSRPSQSSKESEADHGALGNLTKAPGTPPDSSSRSILLNLVDLYDEFQGLQHTRVSGGEIATMICDRLRDLIELEDGQIIDKPDSDPKFQRVVEVRPTSESLSKVLSVRQSGLVLAGRIIRKQEVVTSKPNT